MIKISLPFTAVGGGAAGRSIVFYDHANAHIVLARGADGFWRFDKATVARIPAIRLALVTHTKQQNALRAQLREGMEDPTATMITFLDHAVAGDIESAALRSTSRTYLPSKGRFAGHCWSGSWPASSRSAATSFARRCRSTRRDRPLPGVRMPRAALPSSGCASPAEKTPGSLHVPPSRRLMPCGQRSRRILPIRAMFCFSVSCHPPPEPVSGDQGGLRREPGAARCAQESFGGTNDAPGLVSV